MAVTPVFSALPNAGYAEEALSDSNSSTGAHYLDDIIVSGSTPDPQTGNGGEEEPSPEPTPSSDVIYEAEAATLSGAIIDNKHPGFTGTGFVDYNPNAPGGWIEWTVAVPAAGEYTLQFRYALGAAEDRPAEIKVNGIVAAPQLGFPSTGDFAVWGTTSTKAALNAGTNTIRATATGPNGGANIDHLRVHNKPDAEEPAPVVLEEVEVSDIVVGLLLKKLGTLGIIASGQPQQRAIPRIEFMSLLNGALGYFHEDRFKNLELETNVWEKSLEEWDAYVVETAKEAGYVDAGKEGLISPEALITRRDAANMIAIALEFNSNIKPQAMPGRTEQEVP